MIPFTKAHACGNDFLIISEDAAAGYDKAELAQRLCERNTSIGADGVEFFAWTGDFSARVQLYNADGSVAEISGNGTRCVAAWMADDLELKSGDVVTVETDAGPRVCTIQEFREYDNDGPMTLISTDMAVPEFEPRKVELADGTMVDGVFVSMGNPHFVILLGDAGPLSNGEPDFSVGGRAWEEVGEEICFHADFPEQTNVEFVRVLSPRSEPVTQVAIRIYERGVGPTTSSGTGSSAVGTAMIGVYEAYTPLEVVAPGGAQTVEWEGGEEPLFLTGPATLIANGEIY